MALISRIVKTFRKEKTTQTEVAPISKPSVTVVDVGTSAQERTGSIKIVGAGGTTTGGSSGGTITEVRGSVTPEQVEQFAEKTGSKIQIQRGLTSQQRQVLQQRADVESLERGETPSRQQVQGFSGKVQEFDSGQATATSEKFFVRGEEVGQIRTAPSGERFAVTQRPARLTFAEEQRGSVSSIMFGDEGAEIVNQDVSFPSLNTENVGDVIDYNNPYARQGLPPLERLKFAYESAGKTQYGEPNIRGAIRSGFELVQIGLEKTPIYHKIAKFDFPVSMRIPEDIALSTFLLAPSTSSTAQIERQLFEVSKVRILGVTQQAGKTTTGAQRVITQAGFDVQRAGRNVRGVVSVKSLQQGQAVLSAGKIKTFTRAYNFPTASQVITPKAEFKVGEVAKVVQKGGITFSKSYGNIKELRTLAPKEIYRGESVAKQFKTKQGKFILQLGATQSKSGGLSYSTGILKIKSRTPDVTFISTPSSTGANLYRVKTTTPSIPLKAISIQTTKNIIGATVKIPPQRITNIIPVVSIKSISAATQKPISIYAGTGLYERTEGGQVPNVLQRTTFIQTQEFKTLTKSTPTFKYGVSQRENQLSKVLQIQQQKGKQEQTPRQTQFQIPQQRTEQRQKTLSLLRFSQVQQQQQKGIFAFKTPSARTSVPKLAFFFKTPEKATARQPKFEVLGRRFGKFRLLGYGKTELEALNIGRQFASTTLGATFKVPKSKALNIFGFKTKISKKEGKVFIELPKYRLSTGTEKKEIQYYKGLKGGKKRK